MKKLTLATLVLAMALPAGGVFAQQKMNDMKCADMKDMKCMDMSEKSATNQHATHMAKGMVKKIDTKTGMVTVAHEAVTSMKWPAMTMSFKVKDQMLLEKFTAGNKVEFEFKQEGKDFVVTAVK
ncbi:MAG: copper-binding protein [Burkholderiales bacterium]|jgi:Cu(I)/Ag(I) efflux system protein CusF|nr:MAG: copper-binding protein [Burkholderiales bacterium]